MLFLFPLIIWGAIYTYSLLIIFSINVYLKFYTRSSLQGGSFRCNSFILSFKEDILTLDSTLL